MQNKPLVSFILTFYNLPVSMLCECIDSILALSLKADEREIIVVDDGSDKSPLEQLTKYDNDILFIRRPNGGLSVARNTGIQVASGHYLQFVDADDLLVTQSYNHCIEMARQGKSDMVMFDFTESADAKTIFKDSEPISGADFMRQNNIHGMACGYLFRQSILGDLRFSPNIYHEDEEFTPQLIIRAESIQVTNAPAYLYRKRPDSIITSTNVRHKLKRLNDLQDVIIRLDVMSDTLPPDDRVAMQRRVAQLTMDFIYKTIVETHNRHYLERKLTRLRKAGLFPLPDRNYTTKYRWFRRLANTSAGLGLLMKVLPLMNRER